MENIKIDKAVELILRVQQYDENTSSYGCAMREIRGNFINCKDTCKECWKDYLRSLK